VLQVEHVAVGIDKEQLQLLCVWLVGFVLCIVCICKGVCVWLYTCVCVWFFVCV
jgi:hypothetical protein